MIVFSAHVSFRIYRYIMIIYFISVAVFQSCASTKIGDFFANTNKKLQEYNKFASEIAWQSMVDPDNPLLPEKSAEYEQSRIQWQHKTCDLMKQMENGGILNKVEMRQSYLLCRGPRYLAEEAREISAIYDELREIYANTKLCIPSSKNEPETAIFNFLTSVKRKGGTLVDAVRIAVDDSERAGKICFRGERDFEKLMTTRNELVARFVWLAWRETAGPQMRKPYLRLVDIQNAAARRNGYTDIGESWRHALEMPGLRDEVQRLYAHVRPLYVALHAVARFWLRRHYGDVVPATGPIPAHLLGDLWSQDWSSLVDLVLPDAASYDLDAAITKKKWTVHDMIKRADDFYTSMSFPPMTKEFWTNSVLTNNTGSCHGTAANMYTGSDFRMLYCADTTMADVYVIHHEMGHVHYFMAYSDQPPVFQEGTNSAFHEAIGDTIMLGVVNPQHLNRLGLINDSVLFDKPEQNPDENIIETFVKFVHEREKKQDANTNAKEEVNAKEGKRITDRNKDNTARFSLNKNGEIVPITEEIFELLKLENFVDNLESIFKMNEVKMNPNFERKPNLMNNGNEIKFEDVNTIRFSDKNTRKIGGKTSAENIAKLTHKNYSKREKSLKPSKRMTFDELHLLKMAFKKIPQIPFALLLDEYRWALFEGSYGNESHNEMFWRMAEELQGISLESPRGEAYFDAGAKFHVPDNTPYIRYFLSSVLQYQMYRGLCGASGAPARQPIHLCDLYGSRKAGRILRQVMAKGASIHWTDALFELTGQDAMTGTPLLEYYSTIYPYLIDVIERNKIPVGW